MQSAKNEPLLLISEVCREMHISSETLKSLKINKRVKPHLKHGVERYRVSEVLSALKTSDDLFPYSAQRAREGRPLKRNRSRLRIRSRGVPPPEGAERHLRAEAVIEDIAVASGASRGIGVTLLHPEMRALLLRVKAFSYDVFDKNVDLVEAQAILARMFLKSGLLPKDAE